MIQFSFNSLSLNDKIEMLATHGTLIETITYYNHDVALFSLEKDFVEIYYSMKDNRIDSILIAGAQQLEKFLSLITLPRQLF